MQYTPLKVQDVSSSKAPEETNETGVMIAVLKDEAIEKERIETSIKESVNDSHLK